ncbi:MAG: hypothetical protein NT080_03595 [Spirochaetes bacterium]|nr:hypothetical protein [Spirochaetota bacterium]
MAFTQYATDDPVAAEVEKAAFEIFPLLVGAESRLLREQYALAFSNILGNPGEFTRCVTGSSGDRLAKISALLEAFRENAELLVDKTWVEARDEERKSAVAKEIGLFLDCYRSGKVREAFPRFLSLVRGLAHLLFGEQSSDRDFAEYVFRIDPRLGLFFWYVDELGRVEASVADGIMETLLLLGVFFIASF